VKAPHPHAPVDRIAAQPDIEQLPAGDHTVLAIRRLSDSPVHTVSV
jgi:hypothetical protein